MLFSDRSVWTMIHGVGLSGAALMGLSAALFHLWTMAPAPQGDDGRGPARSFAWLVTGTAVMLWASVLVGTFVIFPMYRVPPPPDAVDLSQFPRAFLLKNPDTAWLHAFAMEVKEHMPWIAAMLATAVAFVSLRHPSLLRTDDSMRRMTAVLLVVCFALVGFVGLLGTLINKVAPLQ
jgi:heme A synthase